MTAFNIREDLESRSFDQQLEILWISGPSAYRADRIAQILKIDTDQVIQKVKQLGLREASVNPWKI